VKKKGGHGTRPKVLLEDVRLPPLRREIDTGATICLQTNILIRRQVDRVLGRRPKAFLTDINLPSLQRQVDTSHPHSDPPEQNKEQKRGRFLSRRAGVRASVYLLL